MKITTNNVPRDTTDAWELTPDERKEFDYLDWAKIDAGEDSASFVRYRGDVLDLGTFMRVFPGGELLGPDGRGLPRIATFPEPSFAMSRPRTSR